MQDIWHVTPLKGSFDQKVRDPLVENHLYRVKEWLTRPNPAVSGLLVGRCLLLWVPKGNLVLVPGPQENTIFQS